jgi:hypothetical protein
MSWLIDDSVNNSNAHLTSYDSEKYYSEDSWRLTKNMALIAPSNQKYQTERDIDSFLVTDEDFGFDKKYNGFAIKTSDKTKHLEVDGEDIYDTESYNEITSKTFTKIFSSYYKSYSKKETWELLSDYYTGLKEYTYNAIARSKICLYLDGDEKIEYSTDGGTTFFQYIKTSGNPYYEINVEKNDKVIIKSTYNDLIISSIVIEITSFYGKKREGTGSKWTDWNVDKQNCGEISIWCPGYSELQSGDFNELSTMIRIGINDRNLEKDILACVYVGGILTNSKVLSASNKFSFDVDIDKPSLKGYEDMKPKDDGLITFLVRYNDGINPCVFMEDEIYEVMKRSQRNPSQYHYGSITNVDTVFSLSTGFHLGVDWTDRVETLNGPDFSLDRAGYEMSTKQISVLMKPRFNSIPFSNCYLEKTGRTPPNSSYSYIAPNVKHYKSGFFTVTKTGTVTLKASLHSLEFYTSYDTFATNAQHLTVYVNGTSIYSKSSSLSSVSISEAINVNEGDLIAVSFTGVMFNDTYYQLDYDYDICEKNYLTGPESNRVYQRVISKTSYNSSHSDGSDYVFIADSDGTLTASDMYLFVNGESVSSGTVVKKGDLILVRINQKSNSYELDNSGNSYDNGYGHWEKKYFLWFETSKEWVWDKLENFKFSFSGSGKLYGYTYDESWEHYVSCVIVEAARWISENNLSEGAPLPLAIIDDENDQEKVDKTFKVLDDASIYVDLWLRVKNIDGLYECDNLISKIVGFALNAPITIRESAFENNFFIKEVRIKDATGGVNVFRHTIEEIPAQVNKFELVDISGDWAEAFKGSVTPSANIGKFTTKELTSAYCMFNNCDLHYLTEDVIKAFFNDTYDKWYEGDILYRSAFVGCRNSGTVPEAYMSVEDQYECNWDPATLIQKVVSKYDVNILPLGCYFYGLPNYTDASRLYLSSSSTVHTIKVEARQYDETKDQAAKIYIDNKLLKTSSYRGHYICVIDCKTKAIKFERQVDTYGEPTSADSVWAEVVGLAGENDIIVATSCDATSLTQAARDIMNSVGGISSIGTWTQSRTAHAFIGKKGIGVNKGLEMTQSGSEYSVIEASFDEDRGLVHQDWTASQTFGLSPVYENADEYPLIKVEEADFWKWGPVFSQIKDCYDYAGFIYTPNNKVNFDIEVLTSGDEKQVNPNYETSFKGALSKSTFENLTLHLSNVEGVNGTNINIESMFKDISELHCVKRVTNVYDMTSAFENCKLTSLDINLDNVGVADYAFKNCDSLKTVKVVSNSCFSAMHMFEDCDVLEDFDLTGMISLIDGTSMFENCVGLKTDFTKPSKLPNNLQIARRMFIGCNVKKIGGNWIPPNAYTSYRNLEENGIGNLEDVWPGEVVLSKEGWSFPEQLSDAYMMFKGNPIIKVSNLSFNPNANNSWIFQDCENLIILEDSFLNIDTFNDAKHTGMFDGCSLKKENVLWLPISISSKFELKRTGITSANNEKPLQYLVDDHWCEVDNSGFVEYQHIRRPAYLQVYKDNDYDDILIKFWSHPHIHSAEMRGFNELHDTKIYYDPESLHGGLIDCNKWLKKD